MQVILKRVFFVGGNRYRSNGKSPVEMPDEFRNILPKDAVVVGEPEVEVVVGEPEVEVVVPVVPVEDEVPGAEKPYVNPAHELDPDRAFSESLSSKNEEAKSEVDSLRNKFKTQKKGK